MVGDVVEGVLDVLGRLSVWWEVCSTTGNVTPSFQEARHGESWGRPGAHYVACLGDMLPSTSSPFSP